MALRHQAYLRLTMHGPKPNLSATILTGGHNLRWHIPNGRVRVKTIRTTFRMFCVKGNVDGGLSTVGKRSLSMFQTYRCGTPHEVTDVIQFTLKTKTEELCS